MLTCICTPTCSNLEKQYLAKEDGHTDANLQVTRAPTLPSRSRSKQEAQLITYTDNFRLLLHLYLYLGWFTSPS